MQPFHVLDSVAVPLAIPNLDTDQIYPIRFIREPREKGLGDFLLRDLRYDAADRPTSFVMNRPQYAGAQIVIGDDNFACGSSREHAAFAFADHGVRAIIAPSFGDIFFDNCFSSGMLPLVLPAETCAALRATATGARFTVDLPAQLVRAPDGTEYRFAVDPFRKDCLLRGVDELDFALLHQAEIAAFERREAPWLRVARDG